MGSPLERIYKEWFDNHKITDLMQQLTAFGNPMVHRQKNSEGQFEYCATLNRGVSVPIRGYGPTAKVATTTLLKTIETGLKNNCEAIERYKSKEHKPERESKF